MVLVGILSSVYSVHSHFSHCLLGGGGKDQGGSPLDVCVPGAPEPQLHSDSVCSEFPVAKRRSCPHLLEQEGV